MRKNLNAVALIDRNTSDVAGILTPEAAEWLEAILGPNAPYLTYSVDSGDPDFFISMVAEGCENTRVMAHEDWLVCCDALRVFYRRRHTIDLEAEEQTISWGKQTFTIRKIDDCTWEVL